MFDVYTYERYMSISHICIWLWYIFGLCQVRLFGLIAYQPCQNLNPLALCGDWMPSRQITYINS